jgi:hypothetical protein
VVRVAISWLGALSFSLGGAFGAVAQTRNVPEDHWQTVDKSMTDLLLEGYRPVSVIAPSARRRIYFLSSGTFLAKCTEDATLMPPPPPPQTMPPPSAQMVPPSAQMAPSSAPMPPLAQHVQDFDPRDYKPEIQSTFTCSRLSKSN